MLKGGGPTKIIVGNCGAFDHAFHAPQSLSDNYYYQGYAIIVFRSPQALCSTLASLGFYMSPFDLLSGH